MPSLQHQAYRQFVLQWFSSHQNDTDVISTLQRYGKAALVLWNLDLAPAYPILKQGYAAHPRGGDPWDPLIILRSLLLSLLVGQGSINLWAQDLKANSVLRVLSGIEGPDIPGVGTFYDYLHRLHDGPLRKTCSHEVKPSEDERRRANTPKAKKTRKKETKAERRERKKKRQKDPLTADGLDGSVTAQLVATLKESQTLPNANDLLGRLSLLLIEVAVNVSATKNLLGNPTEMIVSGDGSPLRTGASGHGKRSCTCSKKEHCECPRIYSDPDADFGWDSHREVYFFGHHIYEIVCTTGGHDLPLALRLDPASTSDYVAVLKTFEHLRKTLRDHSELKISEMILDAGHDAGPIYRYFVDHGVWPYIPLKTEAPAHHPHREKVALSKRGVPLCQAKVEMVLRGASGAHGQVFACPLKAGKLERCPLAPEGAPMWSCQPLQKIGPTVTIQMTDNPRLFPPVPRNHERYQERMNFRSASERSFSVKKVRFNAVHAKHRRASFWLIRLHLMAMLQHTLAWVAHESVDEFLDGLLGKKPMELALKEAA